jgi:hypothetical protein
MARTVRSMRGELVDFDLMSVKEKLASGPVLPETLDRQRYISKRRRRVMKTDVTQLVMDNPIEDTGVVLDNAAASSEGDVPVIDVKPTVGRKVRGAGQ